MHVDVCLLLVCYSGGVWYAAICKMPQHTAQRVKCLVLQASHRATKQPRDKTMLNSDPYKIHARSVKEQSHTRDPYKQSIQEQFIQDPYMSGPKELLIRRLICVALRREHHWQTTCIAKIDHSTKWSLSLSLSLSGRLSGVRLPDIRPDAWSDCSVNFTVFSNRRRRNGLRDGQPYQADGPDGWGWKCLLHTFVRQTLFGFSGWNCESFGFRGCVSLFLSVSMVSLGFFWSSSRFLQFLQKSLEF